MSSYENVLKIVHLNDLHSHFENYPKIKRFFAAQSAGFLDVLRFDLGDNVDRSHPLSEATLGQANIALMNDLNLTAATIGNNEGLGLQKSSLNRLYDSANFPVILANLKDKGRQPNWALEKMTIETSFGMTVDIFGLTAPYPLAYPLAGWEILDPMQVLSEQLRDSQADFRILLSHVGWRFDDDAAAKFDNLDLILGSHTHHLYEYGRKVNGTMIAAAGRYGEHVGEITLYFDESFNCIRSEIFAENTRHLPSQVGDKELIQQLADRGHALLQTDKIMNLPSAISNDFPQYEATHFVAEILGDFYQIPAVIINSGMIVKPIPAQLTRDDLHEILPHSIRMVKFSVNGAELQKICFELYEISSFLKTQKIKGMGFRGKTFGDLVMVGLLVENGRVYYQDVLVSDTVTYDILVPDQYYFAAYFPILKNSGQADILFPRFMREIVADYLKEENKWQK
ncbi:multifunctional 2',3'-cyclic-nucleotide 2'-phosphodiesterase/5'-nucleotidase/3'-nucleotidase [Lactococcus hodotermopsidis]|uniref:Multifunctional 2',3'-cyclic-nucleotide 2'-phosphodiesterase/5'-nucleotidase/3'-nucleotidase n=1 Tax=Pseudolactococcus hodotermopsidis TaxID=2709157 RepID=A0A6A0BA77_9LACT|nr:bifunctional UDP-sugar hydrolase/5'-nucleotidase [Lactococcus hodotermopsidis]GFH42292.1 multifunctional 2',3'-cyclic-nucleotide 2'-phosphodiesterase/5'-nucleotidase/3'-nucleotidase [Lactococcus hodotermopsidis]